MMEIMNSMQGVNLHEKHGSMLRFPIYLNRQMAETTIESLDLSIRSYNSLKRAGYSTVGDLAEAVAGGKNLKTIRNCGAKSAREIMEKLFLYQYNSLKPDKRDSYLAEVVLMNIKGHRSE